MSPSPLMPALHVYRGSAWKPATQTEFKAAQKWSGMDALVSLDGHVFIRNSKGTYDRWRGGKHKPGDEPR